MYGIQTKLIPSVINFELQRVPTAFTSYILSKLVPLPALTPPPTVISPTTLLGRCCSSVSGFLFLLILTSRSLNKLLP